MNIEEKAKRYAQSVVGERKNYIGDEIYNSHIEYASQCFTAGYTQAVTDLNAENEKLREVLREFVDIEERILGLNKNKTWVSESEILQVIDKAKQLITEEK